MLFRSMLRVFGMVGAPLAAVLTQIFMMVAIVQRIDQTAKLGIRKLFPWSHYLRTAGASLAGLAPLAAAKGYLWWAGLPVPAAIELLVGIPVFLAVYLTVANALGVLTDEDRAFVRRWVRLEPLRKGKAKGKAKGDAA